MLELRNSKTTYLGKAPDGRNRFTLDAFMGAVQMREPEGNWQDIKPRLVRDANGWHVEDAPYHCEIGDDGSRKFYPDKNETDKYLYLPTVPLLAGLLKEVEYSPTCMDGQVLPNRIVMPTPWGKIMFIITNTGLRFQVLFEEPPPFDRIAFDVDANGMDMGKLLTERRGLGIPQPRLIGSGRHTERIQRHLDWSFSAGQLELGFDLTGLQFPVLLKNTTIDKQVGAAGDDGYVYGNAFNNNEDSLFIGTYNSTYSDQRPFARWDDITIPVGATINANTYMQFFIFAIGGQSIVANVHMVDEADPAAPTNRAQWDADPTTGNYAAWTFSSGMEEAVWEDSPSLQSAVQELVNSYDYSSGAAMMVKFLKSGTWPDGNEYEVCAWEYSASYAPKLHIEYTAGATEKSSSDVGSGVDAKASNNPLATLSKSETGSGTDSKISGTPVATLVKFETGSGVEGTPIQIAILSKSDSGSGVDAKLSFLAALSKADSGTGTDSLLNRFLTLLESGSGVDTLATLLVAILGSDTGSGIEQSILSLPLTSFDSGLGVDAGLSLLVSLSKADNGAGVEGISGRDLIIHDFGAGADSLAALLAAILGSDTGSGIEQSLLSIIIDKFSSEAGSGTELATLIELLVSGDGGIGSDLSKLMKDILVSDGGTGGEALKALVAATGSSMRLPDRQGHVRKPSKQVRKPSKGVNL